MICLFKMDNYFAPYQMDPFKCVTIASAEGGDRDGAVLAERVLHEADIGKRHAVAAANRIDLVRHRPEF